MRNTAWALVLGAALAACGSDDKKGTGKDTGGATTEVTTEVDSAEPETAVVTAAPDGDDTNVTPETDDADTGPCPGCPQSPCQTNDDCQSGFCLDGPNGLECAATCQESCPVGYGCRPVGNAGGDPTFVCVSDHVTFCEPCREDSDCELGFGGVTNARCLENEAGQGKFCRTRCTPGSCPRGATCEAVTVEGTELSLCTLDEGECACSGRAIGRHAATDCGATNAFGTCSGLRTCEAAGLTACDAAVAAAETCNGADDNCDGHTDESFPNKGTPCDGDDSDKCLDGTWVCGADGALSCTDDASSKLELCNGADDDCDSQTDEDFTQLGLGCDGPDEDKCANGTWACDAGGLGVACDETVSAQAEICDGLDNDCDSLTDEDFAGLGANCDGDDADACKDGKVACAAGGLGTACSDDANSLVELCNGVDDDCDTAVDEGFENKNQPCDGADADGCKDGFLVCSLDGLTLVCNDDGSSRVEVCNELDDDCNATPDDLWPDKLKACDGVDTDKCADGIWVCSPDGSGLACTDDGVSHLEVCNDVDDDCDGGTDEDFPTKGQACDSEVDTDLCNGGVWVCGPSGGVVCNDDANSIAELCNGADDDCDGKTDAADPDLVAPLNGNQNGLCAGTHQVCAGVVGWADNYGAVAGFGLAETPDDKYLDENCDGLDGDATQVFVAKGGTNAGTCTQAAPCLTINFAIGKVANGRRQIYVQAGTYDEIVEVDRQVEIYGGFDSNWSRRPRTEAGHKVTIRGAKHAVDGEYMTVRARSATGKLADLYLEAKSPASDERKNGRGLSSYVVHAVSSTLTLERVELVQGNGATGDVGAAGTDAPSLSAPGKAGAGGAGTQGTSLCSASEHGVGSSGATNGQCSAGTAGGRGGNGGTMDGSCFDLFGVPVCDFLSGGCAATSGTDGVGGSGSNAGSAGASGQGANTCSNPQSGGSGGTPSHGTGGSAGVRGGAIASNYWSGGDGSSGTLGSHGSGGGGGGGSGGCDQTSDIILQNSSGAGGGGGGAGGCRAAATGGGGKAGGSSFGVFAVGGSVTFKGCHFVRGNGGAGGAGGAGGRGQPGGAGGDGGAAAGTAKAGGSGGTGGEGGASGGGGGGAGGSSFGVFVSGAVTSISNDTEFTGGSLGAGGAGGSAPNAAGNAGLGKKGGDGTLGDSGTCAAVGACGF